MLLNNNVVILLIFLYLRVVFTHDELCRLVEFDFPQSLFSIHSNAIEDKLFYKTDYICQNKPVFRSMKYPDLYQFQSANNRWWTLYNTTNSTYKLGIREWCDAWNMKAILSMPLGMFQHPLGKQKKIQRWQRVIIHEKNNSYKYKSIPNVHLKCYSPPSTPNCQTEQLTFLFDLTETTTNEEFHQMKSLTKTLIWLLYNQTKLALSYYRDRFHLINSFDNKTSSQTLEYLYDSIETMNRNSQLPKRYSVQWSEAIHSVVTEIFKRRFFLPLKVINSTEKLSSLTNDSLDEDIYTDPYPLIYSDDHAIKTILNITTYLERKKRANPNPYNPSQHVLVILTSRSKSLHDYKQRDQRLAQFIASVPLRIVVIDFNQISNQKIAEYIHSAFIHNAKYALASPPTLYNYIETYDKFDQLFDYYHRLCYPIDEKFPIKNFSSSLTERNDTSTMECTLITLFIQENRNLTLKETFDYTFYQTPDRCFSAPVYRSLGDRNIYVQRISNGRWLIIHVDPLLPSTISIQQKYASTTTSTLPPEFYYATDYANGPMLVDGNSNNESSIADIPTSVPHCSNTPGIDILWESDDSLIINEYSLRTPRQWISDSNQSDLITPLCNKYQISCHRMQFDLVILIDCHHEYISLIQILLNTFLSLIEPFTHRISFIVLTSKTSNTLQYHLPLTSINSINMKEIENLLLSSDYEYNSTIQLTEHIQHASEYFITNQQAISKNILTISSRLNFNRIEMEKLIQRYSTIRYMVLDPDFKTDEKQNFEREKLLHSLTSSPYYMNLFSAYSSYRDLTFNTVFRLLENLCGDLR